MWPRLFNRSSVLAAALALTCAAACGHKKNQAAERVKAAAQVEGLGALPADVRVVVGANVPRLRDAGLVKRAFEQMLRRDPTLAARLAELETRCKLDPAKDLDSVIVGLAGTTAARDVVMVAKGRFDEAAITACVDASLKERGGSLEKKQQGGMTLYLAKGTVSGEPVAFTFGAPDTIILADSEALLLRARDPAQPKVKTDQAMMALVGRTDTRAGLWGAGKMAPEVGQGLVAAAGVKAPAAALWGHVDLQKGLSAELALEMGSAEDAKTLVDVVSKQLASYAVVAQAYALGPVVAKIHAEAKDKVFVVTLALDAGEVQHVEQVLSGSKEPGTGTDGGPGPK
jgi:hypothetical protein